MSVADFPNCGRLGLDVETDADGVFIPNVISEHHTSVVGEVRPGDRIVSIENGAGRLDIERLTSDSRLREKAYLALNYGPPNEIIELQLESPETKQRRTVKLSRTKRSLIENRGIAITNNGVLVGTHSGVIDRSIDGTVNQAYSTSCSALALNPNKNLAAIAWNGEVEFWNLQKKQRRDRLATGLHETTLKYSPDAKYLVAATGNRLNGMPLPSRVSVWESETFREVAVPLIEGNRVFTSIDFTPDSSRMVVSDHSGKVRIWSTETWELESTLNGLPTAIAVRISGDGKRMVQGGRQGIVIWDFQSQKVEHVLPEYNLTDIAFSNDGKTLIAIGQSGAVFWLDVVTGMQLASMPLRSGLLMDLDLSRDGGTLAAVSYSGDIWVQEFETLSRIDRHPFTFAALHRRAQEQANGRQDADAVRTLKHLLHLQSKLPPDQQSRFPETKNELLRLLRRQAEWPTITTQPRSQRVSIGSPAKLRVKFTPASEDTLRYQWFFEGKAIEGENRSIFEIPRIDKKQLGRYHVEIHVESEEFDWLTRSDIATLRDNISTPEFETGLRKELFLGLSGSSVDDLIASPKFPLQPDDVSTLNAFALPSDFAGNYGARISGFIVPPKTGDYVFYLCSDDASRLYLGSDSQGNPQLVARVDDWHSERGWEDLGEASISAPIHLEAGSRYPVTVLFKEGDGDDHLAVTWQLPDKPPPENGDPPIPGEFS